MDYMLQNYKFASLAKSATQVPSMLDRTISIILMFVATSKVHELTLH